MSVKRLFEKTVFLFGAGASMDAGCLSSKQMLQDLKKSILALPTEGQTREHYLAIYDFILQGLVYQNALKDSDVKVSDITNIEDFVSVLRQMIDREYIVPAPLVGNWNSKITTWESKNEYVFREMLDFTYECLIKKWTTFDVDKARTLVAPFSALIESSENFDLRVFSLNYDLIFEAIFNNERERLVDIGFSQKKWTGDFDDPESPAKLKLYKLHGSVDWYFDNADEEVKQGAQDDTRPLIVFGSGAKIQSYDPFLSLLSYFRHALKEAQLFVVVGYSFQDKYINNILIQSLGSELNKKMLVIDPALPDDKMAFIKRVERFQSSKSLNEIISLTRISPDRVDLLKIGAQNFFSEYLSNSAEKLSAVLTDVEKGDQVFSI